MTGGCTDQTINHAVVLVGYGTSNGVKFWKIRNSWGAWWGESGYVRLVRDQNACRITSVAPMYISS